MTLARWNALFAGYNLYGALDAVGDGSRARAFWCLALLALSALALATTPKEVP